MRKSWGKEVLKSLSINQRETYGHVKILVLSMKCSKNYGYQPASFKYSEKKNRVNINYGKKMPDASFCRKNWHVFPYFSCVRCEKNFFLSLLYFSSRSRPIGISSWWLSSVSKKKRTGACLCVSMCWTFIMYYSTSSHEVEEFLSETNLKYSRGYVQ